MKQYTMLPIERPANAPVIKRAIPHPVLSSNKAPKTYYRVLLLENDIATITSDVRTQPMNVVDVDIRCLGYKSLQIGDILAYQSSDNRFENPIIAHRASQKHQHPEKLIFPEER